MSSNTNTSNVQPTGHYRFGSPNSRPLMLVRPRTITPDIWSQADYETRLSMVTNAYTNALMAELRERKERDNADG